MSGQSDDEESFDWSWAHLLWQKKGIRMEDFVEMPHNVKLAYIASEQLADEYPIRGTERLAKAYIKVRK